MGFFKKAAVATALATAVVGMLGQGGAFATSAGGAIGTGTISPGLSTTCTVQTSVTFDSVVLLYASTTGPTVSATASVHFAGASAGCETVVTGQGGGTLSGGLAGPVTYSRTGNLVTLGGTINGESVLAGACIFVPTDANPTTAYGLVCAAATS